MPRRNLLPKLCLLALLCLLSLANWHLYHRFQSQITPDVLSLQNYQHPLIPQSKNNLLLSIDSPNYILIDSTTNTTLLAKNSHQKIFPASTTKLATAITALNVYPLDEWFTINQAYDKGKVMELVPGEKITVRSLVSALLIYSANDAAFALANHHSGGVDGFIRQMNLVVQRYGLTGTNFTNYDGIHDYFHHSTVYDLAQLGRLSIKNPIVVDTVKKKTLVINDVDNTISHSLESTNELLGVVPEVEGLKTGWTPEAGGCFIGLINIGGHRLISVVAQSQDRFADTRQLITWAKDNVTWTTYQP